LTAGKSANIGLCVPSSCSEEEVSEGLDLIKEASRYTFRVANCISKEERPELTAADVGYMLVKP